METELLATRGEAAWEGRPREAAWEGRPRGAAWEEPPAGEAAWGAMPGAGVPGSGSAGSVCTAMVMSVLISLEPLWTSQSMSTYRKVPETK